MCATSSLALSRSSSTSTSRGDGGAKKPSKGSRLIFPFRRSQQHPRDGWHATDEDLLLEHFGSVWTQALSSKAS